MAALGPAASIGDFIRSKMMGGLQSLGGMAAKNWQQGGQAGQGAMGGMGGDVQGLMKAMMLQNVLKNNMSYTPATQGANMGDSLSSLIPLMLMGMGGKAPISGSTGFSADEAGGLPPGSLLHQQALQQMMHQNPMLQQMQGGGQQGMGMMPRQNFQGGLQ